MSRSPLAGRRRGHSCHSPVLRRTLVAVGVVCLSAASSSLAAQVPSFTLAGPRAGLDEPYASAGTYGPGVAIIDIDDDGDLDLFVPNDLSGHKLYINTGQDVFVDTAASRGLDFVTELPPMEARVYPDEDDPTGMMPNFIDTDNDGDLDFFLTCWNSYNRFFENVGGFYVDRTQASGLGIVGHSATAAWADYNQDGLLDVYIADWGGYDHLFKNDGDNTWTDVSQRVGLYDVNQEPMPGWCAIWFDHNGDGWLDLYVGNDYGLANFFYLADGAGGFEERGRDYFPELNEPRPSGYGAAMGQALGDYDRDGDYDLFVANSLVNDFYRNDNGQFLDMMEMPEMVGPGGPLNTLKNNDIGWFCDFPDVNNDGWVDLFLVNGYIRMCMYTDPSNPDCIGMGNMDQPNLLWINRGDGGFDRVTEQAGVTDTRWGKAGGFADFDRDGDLDLFVSNSAGMDAPTNHGFWVNETPNAGHWSILTLEGTSSNRDALGAEVRVYAGGVAHRRGRFHSTGYLSQSSPELHFGLGAADAIDSVVIRWPRGMVERIRELPVDRRIHFVEGLGHSVPVLLAPDLQAQEVESGIELRWSTDGTGEFDRFLLMRQEPGVFAGTVAEIEARAGDNHYSWVDHSVRGGVPYRYTLVAERRGVRVESAPTLVSMTSPDRRVAVRAAFPNPFNPKTTLRYWLPREATQTRLRIVDLRGRHVKSIVADERGVWASVEWDGSDDAGMPVASGAYRFVVEADGSIASTALTLVR